MTETYLGTRAAARILGVHENTVRSWVNKGVFRGVHVLPFSGWRRIPRSEVERVLNEMRQDDD